MMKALHSLWAEPSFSNRPFYMEDFEILTMVISALAWKKYNGSIKIVADEKAMQYLNSMNLISIYDEIQDLIIDEKINPKTFWAAGKLFALQYQKEPYAVIDTDFIIWKNIEKFFDTSADIVVAHKENLKLSAYPGIDYFKMDDSFHFNKGIDWNALPYNTAFLYIRDNIFKNYYISESINFMRHCIEKENDVCSMVFAEQRMLGICASQWNMTVETLMNEYKLDVQKSFTHVWGYKYILRKNSLKRHEFCLRCVRRIKSDFPEMIKVLAEIPQLTDYFV